MTSRAEAAYVYGPVPSRRLGQSLGVDPIPLKTCNYNCVYCQLGRTRPVTNERRDYIQPSLILAQLRESLAAHPLGSIDYVTFVGQGEPTLCASLGRLIRQVKEMSPMPVAVITNGALMLDPQVRDELSAADVVMPSLDAADQETFRRINRPWPGFRIDEIIAGLVAFRACYAGQLWIEAMLVRGANDDEPHLRRLAAALARIGPDRVHVNVPMRPPAEPWVEVPAEGTIRLATQIIGERVQVVPPLEGSFYLSGPELAAAVLAIIRRHPMREVELLEALQRHDAQRVQDVLDALEASGQIRRRAYRDEVFVEHAGARFAEPGGTTHEG